MYKWWGKSLWCNECIGYLADVNTQYLLYMVSTYTQRVSSNHRTGSTSMEAVIFNTPPPIGGKNLPPPVERRHPPPNSVYLKFKNQCKFALRACLPPPLTTKHLSIPPQIHIHRNNTECRRDITKYIYLIRNLLTLWNYLPLLFDSLEQNKCRTYLHNDAKVNFQRCCTCNSV